MTVFLDEFYVFLIEFFFLWVETLLCPVSDESVLALGGLGGPHALLRWLESGAGFWRPCVRGPQLASWLAVLLRLDGAVSVASVPVRAWMGEALILSWWWAGVIWSTLAARWWATATAASRILFAIVVARLLSPSTRPNWHLLNWLFLHLFSDFHLWCVIPVLFHFAL